MDRFIKAGELDMLVKDIHNGNCTKTTDRFKKQTCRVLITKTELTMFTPL